MWVATNGDKSPDASRLLSPFAPRPLQLPVSAAAAVVDVAGDEVVQ